MIFFSRHSIVVLAILILPVLGGCGSNPTATPAPTLSPTTVATNSPATAPHPLPTSTLPAEILAAFKKTRAVQNVRFEITSLVTFMQNGKTVTQPGLNAQGKENGENRHLAISGTMNSTGEMATFEFVTLNGVTYIKGLNGIPGVNPAQWYRFPQELGNVTHDAPSVKSLLSELEAQDLTQGAFQTAGNETLDNQSCTLWRAHNTKLAEGFIGIANNHDATGQLKALDDGEFLISICADGYLHRITGKVKGHNPDNPAQKASIQLEFHLFDHDTQIAITAPQDATDFQVPMQEAKETPTP